MKILLLTVGSRGDVEPFVALGKQLTEKGHQVDLCTASRFQSMVEENGLSYQYLTDDLFKIMEGNSLESMGSVVSGIQTMAKLIKISKPINRQMIMETIQAGLAVQPELIIYHPKCLAAVSIAEKFSIPAIMAALQPLVVKTASFPPTGLPNLGAFINKLSYGLVHLGYKQYAKELNQQRETLLALPKLSNNKGILNHSDGRQVPVLHAFSQHLVKRPQDWPLQSTITGYWRLPIEDSNYQPSQALSDFLAHDTTPIYIGFGSMSGNDPAKKAQLFIDAIKESGVRAIIATGWGGLKVEELPDHILAIESAPHDWLFPKVDAVVHHGGAGTTAAGLAAGRPTLICPFFGDQPFWGKLIEIHGLGPKPIKQKKLTVENLGKALTQLVSEPRFKENAQHFSTQLTNENGVDNAIEWMEKNGFLKHAR